MPSVVGDAAERGQRLQGPHRDLDPSRAPGRLCAVRPGSYQVPAGERHMAPASSSDPSAIKADLD